VTTILKLLGKDALIGWANSLGWKRKRVSDELAKASAIGSIAHTYIEKIIKGETIELKLDVLSDDIKIGVINSLNSFIKWWKKNKHRVELLNIELELCGLDYGGTADLVCLLDGELTILDFKTSGNFYFTMFLQLAAYAKLYNELVNKIDGVSQVGILRVDKKNGNEAQLMTMDDVIDRGNLSLTRKEAINEYISVYDKIADLFYSIYDISKDWGCDMC